MSSASVHYFFASLTVTFASSSSTYPIRGKERFCRRSEQGLQSLLTVLSPQQFVCYLWFVATEHGDLVSNYWIPVLTSVANNGPFSDRLLLVWSWIVLSLWWLRTLFLARYLSPSSTLSQAIRKVSSVAFLHSVLTHVARIGHQGSGVLT